MAEGKVNRFLGVPYAQPPVGDLRWKHALTLNASNTTVDATKYGSSCGQLLVPGYGSVYADAKILVPPASESEDCLNLNVWAPSGGSKLPVIVFVYGR